MPFITQGKTNWKFLLIVVALAAIVGGGILVYQWWIGKQETKISELKISEQVDIKKYLHKDAILEEGITPMMRESGYAGISVGEAVMYAIQHLEARGVKNIEICEAYWVAAPLKGYLINGKGSFNIEDKHYSTFRIGIRDGAEGNVGDDFVFIARGEDDESKVIWCPEPGPDFHPAEGEVFPEELLAYEFLGDREKFESLSSRFIEIDETADWQTYRNEEYGFEIKYPPLLEFISPEQNGYIFKCGKQVGNELRIAMSEHGATIYIFAVYSNPQNLLPEDFFICKMNDIRAVGFDRTEITSIKDVVLGEQKINGKQIIWEGNYTVLAQKGEAMIEIDGKLAVGDNEFLNTFNQILSTFKFIQ